MFCFVCCCFGFGLSFLIWYNFFIFTHVYFSSSFLFHLFLLLFFFLLNWLGWDWLTKLYGFQVYNSIINHLYTILCVHHPKLSLHPSPFISAIISSTFPQTPSLDNHHTILFITEWHLVVWTYHNCLSIDLWWTFVLCPIWGYEHSCINFRWT